MLLLFNFSPVCELSLARSGWDFWRMLGNYPACCFGGFSSGCSCPHGLGFHPAWGAKVCTGVGSCQPFCALWAGGGLLERGFSRRLARATACCRGEVGFLLGGCSPIWGSPLAPCYRCEGENFAISLSYPAWKCPSASWRAVKVSFLGPQSSDEIGGGCFHRRWDEVFFSHSREGGAGRCLVQTCPLGCSEVLLPHPPPPHPCFSYLGNGFGGTGVGSRNVGDNFHPGSSPSNFSSPLGGEGGVGGNCCIGPLFPPSLCNPDL